MTERPQIRVVALPREREQEVRDLDDLVWFPDPTGMPNEQVTGSLDWQRVRGAETDGHEGLAGQYATWHMDLGLPGGEHLGADGLTWVSVHPDLRRRGVLSSMMRHHLTEARERGYAFGALHASEPTIYARFGYAPASSLAVWELGSGTELAAPTAVAEAAGALTTRTVTQVDDALDAMMQVRRAALGTRHGTVSPEGWQQAERYRDRPTMRRGTEPTRVILALRGDEPVGFATFARDHAWEKSMPSSTARVAELVAADDAALLALARRLTSLDLVVKAKVSTAPDSPLLTWAGGDRVVRARVTDSLWLRVLDVERALAARRYSAPVDIVVEVVDALLPEVGGRYRVVVDAAGSPAVTRLAPGAGPGEGGGADVTVPVGLLGAALLGEHTVAALARTTEGVTEHTPGALTRLSRAFATDTRPEPAYHF